MKLEFRSGIQIDLCFCFTGSSSLSAIELISGDGMTVFIRNISQLITCAGIERPRAGEHAGDIGVVTRGALLIDEGLIVWAGSEDDMPAGIDPDNEIDAQGRIVTPGLVDPHTHALFAGSRAREFSRRVSGATYEEIMAEGGGISASARMLRDTSDDDIIQQTVGRLNRMLSYGVTSCEIKSGYGLSTEEEVRSIRLIDELGKVVPLDIIPTYMGAHAIPPEAEKNRGEFIQYIINEMTPAVAETGLAEFCDVFCEEGVFTVEESRRILLGAAEYGMKLKIHADELASSGGTRLGAELGVVSADHMLQSSRADISALREAGGIGVILPGTCLGLGKTSFAPGGIMVELGLPVALATDLNPGNCYCENLPLMITLGSLYAGLSVEQAIIGVTINAAYACGIGEFSGSIETGKWGDIVIWDADRYEELAYHFGVSLAHTVLKRGEAVYSVD